MVESETNIQFLKKPIVKVMKKHIIIVGPAWPLRGGLSTYNERLCKALIDMGHNVEILSFSLQYPNLLFPGKTQYSSEGAPNNTSIDTAINSINPLNWIKVGLKYKKIKPDVMVFRYWMPFMAPSLGTIARIVKQNKTTKLIAITDNIYPHEKHFYDNVFTNYFVNSMDEFITMSQSVLSDLKHLTPNKSSNYVPHPMYDNFGESISKEDAKKSLQLDDDISYLLFFGFIRKYKGLDLLLKSFAKSGLQHKKVKLIIAGEYYEDSLPYKTLIKELNLTEHIIEHDEFIPNQEVFKYFCACDMVVQTYHSATQSGVTQIAYHFNKPMLVTNVGGLSETVPNGKVGYVCEKSEIDIAKALTDFYENKKELEFSKNVEAYKSNFSWNHICNMILK
jgi:D-inositol-3-phosphate glycosyltransferase